jgi:inorganic triphosphatase YgiF
MAQPQEIEFKLEVPPNCIGRLVRSAVLKAAAPADTAELTSVYFDTPKHELRKKGLALRVRHGDGHFRQTIKQSQNRGAGLFARGEWEQDIDGEQPDLKAASGTPLQPLIGKKLRRRLRPIFETRVRRRIYPIARGDGEIEVALDRGEVKAGRQSAPLSEAELELKHGNAGVLFDVARALAKLCPLRLSTKSKADRGYALVDGDSACAVKAGPLEIAPEADQQTAFQIIARACLHHLAANEAVFLKDTAAALHEMRVALRRMRAAISLFSDMLTGPQTEAMKAEFKWLGQELGPARELDVFIKRVVKRAEASKPNGAPSVAPVSRDVQRRLTRAFARAEDAIASARYRSLALGTAAWIEAGDWTRGDDEIVRALRERPIADAAAEELGRRRKKIRKQGRKLAALAPRRRHKLRIKVKKLRYAADFFAALFPGKKSARRHEKFVARLKKLQDALGDLNDIMVHERLSQRIVDGSNGARARKQRINKAFTAGRLAGREEERFARVMRQAEKACAGFADVRPFW